jgi:hypothetical protein
MSEPPIPLVRLEPATQPEPQLPGTAECTYRQSNTQPAPPLTNDPTDPVHYPTITDIVHDALAAPTTYTNDAPRQSRPNYSILCEDLDGNTGQLTVVPLGGWVALVGPNGETTVLHEDATTALAGSLEDTLVLKIHGGIVRMGSVKIEADLDVRLLQDATISVDARPYNKTAEIRVEAMHSRIAWPATIDTLRQLQQMCQQAEQVLLGVVPERTNTKNGKEETEPPTRPENDDLSAHTTHA